MADEPAIGNIVHPQTIGDNTPDPNAPVAPVVELTPEQQRIAALEAQIAEQTAQNARMLQTMDLLVQNRQPAAAPQPAPQPVEFSLAGLPDNVENPTGFMAGLQERIRQRDAHLTNTITSQVTTQVSRGAALDSVFNTFKGSHPELAKRDALLRGAALVEFQELQGRGIDPVAVAMQQPNTLITNIAARMNRELGIEPGANGGQQPTNGQPQNAARTVGLGAGSSQQGAKPPAPAVKSFTQALKDAQMRDGLI
jgi:hypothetical protein